MSRLRALVLDADRLDFDGALDWTEMERVAVMTRRPSSATEQIAALADGHDVLVSKESQLGVRVIRALPNSVRLICEAGTGHDNIDLTEATARGITVSNVPGYSTAAVAQLTMSYVLGIASGTIGCVRRASAGDRSDFRRLNESPFEVAGKTLGIVGAGTIGQEVMRLARACGMRVLTAGGSARTWNDPGASHVALPTLLEASEFVTLHCPLISDGPNPTLRLVDRAFLARMKRNAWLINAARGGLIFEPALVEALRSGRIRGAALDVQDPEPPEPDSELWRLPNVHLTPHVGWKAIEARQRLLVEVAHTIRLFSEDKTNHVVR